MTRHWPPLERQIGSGQPFLGKNDNGTLAQAGLRPLLPLLINQDCLLPSAWRLVGAMNAACPAAGTFLALQQLVTGSCNATLARLQLFRVFHPADEFIAAERRQAFPQYKDIRIRAQCGLKIRVRLVDCAMWKSVRHATSKSCGQQVALTHSEQIDCFEFCPLDDRMSTAWIATAMMAGHKRQYRIKNSGSRHCRVGRPM